MLNLSWAEKKCLVIATNPNLSNLLVSTLGHIGISAVTKAEGVDSALFHITQAVHDIVVCATMHEQDTLTILSAIRNHKSAVACRIPVICVSENWTSGQIATLRDAGVNLLATLPLTMRNMMKQVTHAFGDNREFIACKTYRGPCRRRADLPGFTGPFLRQSDKGKSGAPAPPPSPPQSQPQAPRPSATAPTGQRRSASIVSPPPEDDMQEDEELSNDPIQQQTGQDIHAAVQTAHYVTLLLDRMPQEGDPSYDPAAMQYISDYLERWVNLMSLVASRVGTYGCTTRQLDSIRRMRLSFHTQILRYVGGMAVGLIAQSEKVLAPGDLVPIAVGAKLARKLASIDGLIESLGDSADLPDALQADVDQARALVATVFERLAGSLNLAEFNSKGERP